METAQTKSKRKLESIECVYVYFRIRAVLRCLFLAYQKHSFVFQMCKLFNSTDISALYVCRCMTNANDKIAINGKFIQNHQLNVFLLWQTHKVRRLRYIEEEAGRRQSKQNYSTQWHSTDFVKITIFIDCHINQTKLPRCTKLKKLYPKKNSKHLSRTISKYSNNSKPTTTNAQHL